MYNLTWTQAQEAMREGKRVRNSNFTTAEWFAFDGRHIVDEEGYYMDKWYKGYDWQNEGWMILEDNFKPFEEDTPEYVWKEEEIRLTNAERQKMKAVMLGENYAALEEKVVALLAGQGYDVETLDYCVGITPQSPTLPREKQNYNFRITKGRGHNKLQKRKKK